jgi:hypothetical protein
MPSARCSTRSVRVRRPKIATKVSCRLGREAGRGRERAEEDQTRTAAKDGPAAETPSILQAQAVQGRPQRQSCSPAIAFLSNGKVLFASAPVDSDLFTAYLHQNYTQFMTDTDECSNAMEYLSMSDALMRMEGESVCRTCQVKPSLRLAVVRAALPHLTVLVPRLRPGDDDEPPRSRPSQRSEDVQGRAVGPQPQDA